MEKLELTNSKYEDLDLIVRISQAEQELSEEFEDFQKEIVYNFRRVAGELLKKADIQHLETEGRPAFIHNLLLPIILNLTGNFKDNQSKLEAVGRTSDDQPFAELITSILDYMLYTANDIDYSLARSYIDAVIGRIGWITNDWTYEFDPLGMFRTQRWHPLRIKFDSGITDRSMKTCKFMDDICWYTPEELMQAYALQDPDLWEEIDKKTKDFMQSYERTGGRKHATMFDRIFGSFKKYIGEKQGYDTDISELSDIQLSSDWFNSDRELFKTVEFHERRTQRDWFLYDPVTDDKYNITKTIKATDSGRYDSHAIEFLKQQFPGSDIRREQTNLIWQTVVVPSLNMKLYDAPYPVQTGTFKYVPIFCYDFTLDIFNTRSLVDHLADPASSYNKRRNSMLEYLMRLGSGETWAEEGSLGEHEDEFMLNKIGGVKTVKPGAISGNKIERQNPAPFPAGLDRFSLEDKEDIKEISGVRENSQGAEESSSESGKAISLRVAQTEIMQGHIQDNAINQMKMIGEIAKDHSQFYMDMERELRLFNDDTGYTFLKINQVIASGKLHDITAGEFDIIISKSPYGKNAKQEIFQEMMIINEFLMKLNPAYVDPVATIKASSIPNKWEWIERINMIDQQTQGMLTQMAAEKNAEMMNSQNQNAMQMQGQQLQQQKQYLDNKKLSGDLQVQDQIKNAVGMR